MFCCEGSIFSLIETADFWEISLHCNAVPWHEILLLPKEQKCAYKKKSEGLEVKLLASLVVKRPQMIT
jgi:hypothetical protein